MMFSFVDKHGHARKECNRCGQFLASSMSVHQKTWPCYNKSVPGGKGGKLELYKFSMHNMHDLTKMQKWFLEDAKKVYGRA